LPKVRS